MQKAKFVKNPAGGDTLKTTCNLSTHDTLITNLDLQKISGFFKKQKKLVSVSYLILCYFSASHRLVFGHF